MKLSERLAQASDAAAAAPRSTDGGSAPVTAVPSPRPAAVSRTTRNARVAVTKPRASRTSRRQNGAAGSDHAPATLDDLRASVRARVVERVGSGLDELDEERLREELSQALTDAQRGSKVTVSPSMREQFVDDMFADMLGWGALTPLMADPDITEVMCNGVDEVWIERRGVIEHTDVRFPSEASYRQVIDRMLATAGRRVDEASPMADGRLPDGSRVNAILPPLAIRGATLTIRRFPERMYSIADLIAMETISADGAMFLEAAVRGKLNVLVSGGTGTGKTTMLNVLSAFIPERERVITIEDAAELRMAQPHVVTLEARPANIEGAGQVTIRDLVRNALRMRPDRIVVGEVRGPEALDMLQAMNTGHEGSLTTVHANSPRDAFSRIETMVLLGGYDLPLRAIREQMASALNLVVQLQRLADGRRVVSQITEVQGREGETVTMQDLFARHGDGPLAATGLRPKATELLAERGVTVTPSLFRGNRPLGVERRHSLAGMSRRRDQR